MPKGWVGGEANTLGRVRRCRGKATRRFLVFQCSTSLIKSSFCPPYPGALESYSFISRILPLDTCQNKEYGLCISFILLYIRSLSHLNVEPHQRADLSSARRSALHLGGRSGRAVPPPASPGRPPAPTACPRLQAPAAGNGRVGDALGRVTARGNPGEMSAERTSQVPEFLPPWLLANFLRRSRSVPMQ